MSVILALARWPNLRTGLKLACTTAACSASVGTERRLAAGAHAGGGHYSRYPLLPEQFHEPLGSLCARRRVPRRTRLKRLPQTGQTTM